MTNTKLQINTKSKILNLKLWELGIGNCKLFVICLLGFVILSSSALALEVSFPTVQGVGVTDSMGPAEWIHYIFLFAQAMVGLAIIYAFVRAGLIWMTAGDNSSKIKEAREWIYGAVIGLVILLGSYLFLKTINPQLVNLKNPGVNFGTDAPSGMLDFWNKLFINKRGPGEACGSSFDCQGILECIKDPKSRSSQGICTEPHPEDVAYRDENFLCGKGKGCPDNFRCLSTLSGSVIDNPTDTIIQDTGKCINQPTVGEACSTYTGCFFGTCTPNSGDSDSTCVINPQESSSSGGTRASIGSGLSNTEQVEILTLNARTLSNLEGNALSLKTETEWLDMLQVLLGKNLTEEEKNKGKELYKKLKQGTLSNNGLILELKKIFFPGT